MKGHLPEIPIGSWTMKTTWLKFGSFDLTLFDYDPDTLKIMGTRQPLLLPDLPPVAKEPDFPVWWKGKRIYWLRTPIKSDLTNWNFEEPVTPTIDEDPKPPKVIGMLSLENHPPTKGCLSCSQSENHSKATRSVSMNKSPRRTATSEESLPLPRKINVPRSG